MTTLHDLRHSETRCRWTDSTLPTIETLAEIAKELGVPLADFLSDISGQKRIPADRLRMESKLREIGRSLPNGDLALAVGLLEVLARRQSQK